MELFKTRSNLFNSSWEPSSNVERKECWACFMLRKSMLFSLWSDLLRGKLNLIEILEIPSTPFKRGEQETVFHILFIDDTANKVLKLDSKSVECIFLSTQICLKRWSQLVRITILNSLKYTERTEHKSCIRLVYIWFARIYLYSSMQYKNHPLVLSIFTLGTYAIFLLIHLVKHIIMSFTWG